VAKLSPEDQAEFDAIDWDKEDQSWVDDGTTYVTPVPRAPEAVPAARKPTQPK
jgi:hypothetical protein